VRLKEIFLLLFQLVWAPPALPLVAALLSTLLFPLYIILPVAASLVRLLTYSSSFTSAGGGSDDVGGVSSSLSSSTSAGGLLDTAWSDDWKVLLYDAYTKAILSPLLTVAELRACGVTLHLPLESPRDSIPDVSAVYLLSPSPSSMRLLSEDAAVGRYRDCSVFVTPSLPRPQLETLAAACVQSGSVPRIARLLDAYSSFVALQPRLFTSIGLHNSLTAFASPSAGEKEVNAFTDSVTSSLVSLCATVGFCPIIVCSRGGPAEMVARQLESALRDHLASPTAALFSSNANAASVGAGAGGDHHHHGGLADGAAVGIGSTAGAAGGGGAAQDALVRSLLHGRRPLSLGVGPGSRPVLILLDRTVDLATPLSHGSSYESLVDECVGPIEGNRVVLPGNASASGSASSSSSSSSVSLAELDEFHPSKLTSSSSALTSSSSSGSGAAASGGAGAWLMDWAAGKSSSASGADGIGGSSTAAAAGGKTLTLDPDSDRFWSRYCRTVIPEAIEAHERELTEVVAKEQEIRRKAGAAAASAAGGDVSGLESLMAGGGDDGGHSSSGDPSSLSSAIESLPALLKRKKILEVHTSLLQAVWQRVAARMLPHLFEQEQPWLTHPYGSAAYNSSFNNESKTAFYHVLKGEKGTHLDRLRLAAIWLLTVPPSHAAGSATTSGGLSGPGAAGSSSASSSASAALSEEADTLLSLLTSSPTCSPAFVTYASSVLGYVKSLRTSPSLLSASAPHLLTMGASGGGSGAGIGGGGGMASAAGGLLSSLINKAAQQVSRLVEGSSEQRLPVTNITAAICDGKPSLAAPFAIDQYLTLDPKAMGQRERTFGSYVAAVTAASLGGSVGGGAGGSAGGSGASGTSVGGGINTSSSGGISSATAAATNSPASFRNAFVYVVGGCTYTEASDLQAWATTNSASSAAANGGGGSGAGGASVGASDHLAGGGGIGAGGGSGGGLGAARTVVLGGTEIISPASFLAQLKELGKDFATAASASSSSSSSSSLQQLSQGAYGRR
jgi:Sec1 family